MISFNCRDIAIVYTHPSVSVNTISGKCKSAVTDASSLLAIK